MRRIAATLTLLCPALLTLAMPASVHASSSESVPTVVVEEIAHTQVIQTVGPVSTALSWGLDRIDQRDLPLSGSYSYTATGTGVKAYIIDSGIKADHVEFTGRVASGWSYRSASQSTLDAWRTLLGSCKNEIGYNPALYPVDVDQFDYTSTPSDVGSPDNDGHGTHVAGTVGGTTTGVAKGVTLVPVRVLNSCGQGVTSMVLLGLDWILADHQLGEPAVVNMSIGFDVRVSAIDAKIALLLEEGVVVVAAAGNSGISACNTTPAATPGTISVGASSSSDTEPSWSNYGQCLDMYAPGVSITSAWNYQVSTSNPYKIESGTSMAAPHVTGVVARYLQGVVTTSTTETETWSWLDANMTTGKITPFVATPARTQQTPNKLLAIVVPDAVAALTLTTSSRQISAAWTLVVGLTYVVTATPGGATCTTATSGCVISGLTNNQEYSIAVTATNGFGSSRATTVVATPVGPPGAVTGLVAATKSNALDLSWVQAADDSTDSKYTATATPGGATCTSTVTVKTSCTISGLINGTQYTVSVTGTNTNGTGTATTTTGLADGIPEVPATSMSIVGSKSVTVAWPAITSSIGVTYVVTSTPGNVTCSTIETFCVVTGLKNGVNYTFAITTKTATGQVAVALLQFIARPGFTVKKSIVKKNSKTPLSWLVSSISTGKKTWSESGPCSIVGAKLKTPKASASCVVTLKVAKKGKYPAMSTKLRVAVE
ncbi:MAG: S8 family serine peptidase [Actinomycetota bacterium]